MIVAVACRGKDGTVYSGIPGVERHHHLINRMSPNTQHLPKGYFSGCGGVNQGFIDDKGNYLNRQEAAKHATECGQVEKGKAKVLRPDHPDYCFNGHTLYSEDLW
jgi:hypothetical protein